MDLIEAIKKDRAYVKSKLIVKNWEKDFKLKHSRTPSKFDIKEAPSNIKYAYKKYFQLKSTALENSLSICDPDEESVLSPEPTLHLENIVDNSTTPESLLPTLPSVQELDRLLSTPNPNYVNDSTFTEKFSKKLFQNTKFSLRNPRKSIITKSQVEHPLKSKLIIDNSNGTGSANHEKLEIKSDNNEIDNFINKNSIEIKVNGVASQGLTCKIVHNNENLIAPGNLTNMLQSFPLRQINKGWVERATGFSDNVQSNNQVEKFGLGNITMVHPVEKLSDYVENSESDDDIAISKLKPALKKQKTCKVNNNENRHKEEHNDHTNSISNSTDLTNENKIRKRKNERVSNIKKIETKKQVSKSFEQTTQPPDVSEYMPFGLNEKVQPRHNNISDILETIETPSVKDKIKLTQRVEECDKMEKKIQNGILNENFVKINIEKKVFVRGKKNISYSKYKKKLWKDKKALHGGMEFPEQGKITCFKCGLEGHMGRYCTAHREDTLLPLENYEEHNMMTLEDMQKIVTDNKKEENDKPIEDELSSLLFEASKIPEDFLKLLAETPEAKTKVKPVYTEGEENSKELSEALNEFGHNAFLPGQEKAIKRILCGLSTLLILSTGGGKSLCYQLPAYIYSKYYKCITLVISPLVSLMEDQVLSMPQFLKAACLHTNQQPTQRRKIIEYVKSGEINVLLMSPEALISGDSSSGFAGLFKSLPQIAFACIDEAHCVSQWSHNFRPSYLMICRVLREKLNVTCILGLTATASQATIKSIIGHINISDGFKGVLTNPALPNNLHLSISFEKDKDRAIVSLLASEKISLFNSIIVYCIRRNECERVAAVIRSCLSQPGKINMEKASKKRKRMSYIAEAYHAGMSAAQRRKIQKHFMDGSLKIIVATVAFGMGINKSDIRCIIHYNMPPSFESYVQEVGRAGRDGKPAFCHVFMNENCNDKDELLKHIYANSIDRPVIRKLLQKVFIPCKCISTENLSNTKVKPLRCAGHEVGIPIDNTVEELDLPSENIATLLCYVELHHKHYIKVLNNAYTICKISSYGGPIKILEAAKTCPPLAMAYLLQGKKDSSITKSSILEFNVIEVASAIGWESGMTKYHLKNLEWTIKDGISKRSYLKVEFNTLGFRLKAPGDLSASELDSVLDELHETVHTQEKVMLCQLEEINKVFYQLRNNISCDKINFTEEALKEKSDELKLIINNYFTRENNLPDNIVLEERPLHVERVASDVRALIATYKDCKFTGRSIARIFQGISSPNFPALVWGRCKFWRSHLHEDFDGIVRIATQQIIQMKM
ncbi:ATP-dependent DNA helicase Q4 [Nymphalis io]|uniref:ATP-dependent DNA helicase Q4 n=1 Tax=Inachis io TaxID=171585 RepID=UPI00216AABF6|nr:ATP-dependent DNA helicase Q4 [Nymphalis io]